MKFEINDQSEKRYVHGWINRIIWLYYCFQEGNNQFSSLRTIAYSLIGIGAILAIQQSGSKYYMILGVIGLSMIPILTVWGYLWLIRGKKSTDYQAWKRVSPIAKYTTELQEATLESLKDLTKEIKKLNKKL